MSYKTNLQQYDKHGKTRRNSVFSDVSVHLLQSHFKQETNPLELLRKVFIIWVNQTIKFGNLAYMSTITVQIKLKQWSTNLKYIYPYICASASIKADMQYATGNIIVKTQKYVFREGQYDLQ